MEVKHPNYGLSRTQEEGHSDETFVNPLPRAVLRPNSYILLDGEWKFALDIEDKGEAEQWFIQHQYELVGVTRLLLGMNGNFLYRC
jgi:hypothetical protein